MTPQLTWTREADTLVLAGSWIRTCWRRYGTRA